MASLPEHLRPAKDRGSLSQVDRDMIRRDRIVLASIDVFAKRGFRGTTVDHLVAASKVSFGTFYALFDGKESCFIQVYDRVLADAHREISERIPADGTWGEQAAVALWGIVQLITEDPMRARVALIESQTGGPEALASYQAMIDAVIPLLRRGREGSETADRLSPTLEEAIIGGVVWLLHQQLLKEGPESIEAAYPELVDIVIGPYVGAAEAARLAELAAGGDR
jgi:AcrR family transcriptional regulator